MTEEKTVGKVSQFFNRIGRKTKRFLSSIKISIENVVNSVSIKYLEIATNYFNKKAKHLENLRDREEFGRPMLRDIPKYIGIWIYKGFAAILTSVKESLSRWKLDRELAEVRKDSQ
ncbi:hypothetical protein LCGC14_1118470 [marine sediment metagenome]|uniref:Uncharacterized protein n=1 Tax=marine sediment metagenome TaxID=412755 RepID=A0A0F9M9H2_9ZZZZ